jgi:tryptophan synthase alpha chain
MTYYNPVLHFGEERFVTQAKAAGVDGVIVPDLPPEEAVGLIKASRQKKLATIFFLSPTTTKERIKKIVNFSTGFIYYVSVTGVTGDRQELPKALFDNIKLAKKITNKPICVGFGISSHDQVKSVYKIADGVIVGSAIIKEIVKNSKSSQLVNNVSLFVEKLAKV